MNNFEYQSLINGLRHDAAHLSSLIEQRALEHPEQAADAGLADSAERLLEMQQVLPKLGEIALPDEGGNMPELDRVKGRISIKRTRLEGDVLSKDDISRLVLEYETDLEDIKQPLSAVGRWPPDGWDK